MNAATPMPHPTEGIRSPTGGSWRRRRIFRSWHGCCILLLAGGCFDFRPLPTIKKNEAPVFIDQNPPSGTPLILKDRSVQVFVIARDPEGEGVSFQWSRSDGTLIGDAQQVTPETSLVELDPEPSLSGQTLRCTIYDGADVPASVILTWPLEVP